MPLQDANPTPSFGGFGLSQLAEIFATLDDSALLAGFKSPAHRQAGIPSQGPLAASRFLRSQTWPHTFALTRRLEDDDRKVSAFSDP